MTDPTVRREITELFAGHCWPDSGDALLGRSLGPRSPELPLDAPGWLGLGAGGLVLDAGCRDATHAIALSRRYGCRVLGVDLVAAWLPKGLADAAATGGACDLVWCRDTCRACPTAGWRCWRSPGSPATGRAWRPRWGQVWYRRALAFALWRPQILLGRLVPVLYTLVKP
jgi:hypothetical protein